MYSQVIGGSIRKIREYPPLGGGSLTLAEYIDEEMVNRISDKVLSILYREGYRGQYDVEFLVCEDKVYLNEINFRHSGNGYGLIQNGVSAPYLWCLDAVGIKISSDIKKTVEAGTFHMDELSDFVHRKSNHVSLAKWIKNVCNTHAFAVFSRDDFLGALGFCFVKLKRKFGKDS